MKNLRMIHFFRAQQEKMNAAEKLADKEGEIYINIGEYISEKEGNGYISEEEFLASSWLKENIEWNMLKL